MPTSDHSYITDTITIVRRLKPASILDIGVGFGKWGFLFREYLDVMAGRPFPKAWKTIIHGVEIFPRYCQEYPHFGYDHVYNDNILAIIDSLPQYDLIFASDVIEHIEKERAKSLLSKLRERSKYLLCNIPLGKRWLSQGECYSNPHEAHISSWDWSDFKDDTYRNQYACNGKPIGAVGWGFTHE